MPNFTYKAKDPSGRFVEGSLDAADGRSAAGKIRDMGLWPIEVKVDGRSAQSHAAANPDPFFRPPFRFGASLRSLAFFFRQLSTMLQAGMTLGESLDSLGRSRGIGKLSVFACNAAGHVRAGGLFSDAVNAHPEIFTSMQMSMIRAGEVGGMFDSMVARIADYLDKELETRRQLSRITFYPKVVFFFIIIIGMFLPSISGIVMGTASPMPVIMALVVDLLIIAAILVVIRVLLAIRPVRYIWDVLRTGIPVFGTVSRKLAMSRFSTCMSVLYSAGVSLPQAIELSAGTMENEMLKQSVLRVIPEIRDGGDITTAFRRISGMPDLVVGMMSTGERTGSLDLTLSKVSEYYDAEARVTMEKSGYVFLALAIVIAAILTFFIVLSGYSGYTNQLTNMAK